MFQQMQSLVEKRKTTMVTLLLKSTINWNQFTAGLKAQLLLKILAQVYFKRDHTTPACFHGCFIGMAAKFSLCEMFSQTPLLEAIRDTPRDFNPFNF